MKPSPLRTLARLTFANPVSAVYLGLVGVALAVATFDTLTAADATFVWVWPMFLTFPTFGFVVWLDSLGGADAPAVFFIGGIVLSALVQSLALGAVVEAVRGRRGRRGLGGAAVRH
ncbi:SCO4225 family membrane protein [Streptomyces fumanus]|uniref:Uncharacterized protein n=1 Tax=Streptomyces fumanus TaxID=67302 RepID=A0A919AHB7_9ACTN|nr:hypothetical protein [Streptomyces fumanus]GHF03120.1 hypothetical protein GCM10018772_29980 [Streptomyces fumanus]